MLNKKRVLIFPAGAELALEIHNSLRYNIHFEVFGASGKPDHAKFIYDKDHYFEDNFYVTKQDFIPKFNKLLTKLKIDFIMPAHDTITLFLAQHQNDLCAKVITSPYETAFIARNKKQIYGVFKNYIFCPDLYPHPYTDVIKPESIVFPVFIKPNVGEGGKRTDIAHNMKELYEKTKDDYELIPCEYLPGEELGVDCFTNRHGELIFIGPRTRERIQMGISFHSQAVPITEEIQYIADTINKTVKIRGTWFFQIKKDKNGKFKLMEFAVRQASTMGLYRQLGVNFALLSIFDAMDMDVSILKNDLSIELDRCLYNRYKMNFEYDTVYIDFDDTIIVDNKVNETVMKYLYQCRNNNIRICLLTKHDSNIYESLEKYCISKKLFNEIILLRKDEDKIKFIKHQKSIFIDNYFFDRVLIYNKLKMPVFDVDAVEGLCV